MFLRAARLLRSPFLFTSSPLMMSSIPPQHLGRKSLLSLSQSRSITQAGFNSKHLEAIEVTGTSFSSRNLPSYTVDEEGTGMGKFVLLGFIILLFSFEEPRIGPKRKKLAEFGLEEPVKALLLSKAKKECETWLGAPVNFSDEKHEFVGHVRMKDDLLAVYIEDYSIKRDTPVTREAVIEGKMGILGSSPSRTGLLTYAIAVDDLKKTPKYYIERLVLEVSDSNREALIPIV